FLGGPPEAGAHVGSPNVVFEGSAGPYPVRILVRTPLVIPGRAEIVVRAGEDVKEVTVQPLWWDAPADGGAPAPDRTDPVRGAPGLFTGWLWLMTGGSCTVRVAGTGGAGKAEVLVPVAALATRRLPMPRAFGLMLLTLGGLLLTGGTSVIAGAA